MYLPSFALPVLGIPIWNDGATFAGMLAALGFVGAVSLALLAVRHRLPLELASGQLGLPPPMKERSAI